MKNIILVEDDPKVLDMLCAYVKSKGDNAIPFKNGKEVLEFLEKNKSIKINLMITDYEMEPVNGIELVQTLNKANHTFPKIFLTSHNATHLLVKAIESQIFRFIEKPLKYSTLDPLYVAALQQDISLEKDKDFKKLGIAYSAIVHEINNPLNAILLYAELIKENYSLEQKIDPAQLMSQLDTIQSSGFKISDMIKDIKEFINSKPTKIEEFSLYSIMDEIKSGYKAIKNSDKNELRLCECENLNLKFDRGQFYRLIINLLNNAVDATSDRPEKWIKIITQENTQNITLRVVDSGDGISPAIVAKIFEGNYSQKKNSKGTGLGLDLCRKMLAAYNGNLNYELYQGNTSFIISLPKE